MHLHEQGPIQHRREVVGEVRGEGARDLGGERRVGMASQNRPRFLLQSAPEMADERLDERQERASLAVGDRRPDEFRRSPFIAVRLGDRGQPGRRFGVGADLFGALAEEIKKLLLGDAGGSETLFPQPGILGEGALRLPPLQPGRGAGAVERMARRAVAAPCRDALGQRCGEGPPRAIQQLGDRLAVVEGLGHRGRRRHSCQPPVRRGV